MRQRTLRRRGFAPPLARFRLPNRGRPANRQATPHPTTHPSVPTTAKLKA